MKRYYAPYNDTMIKVNNGDEKLLNRIFDYLKEKGFMVQTDQKILRDYPSLADTHFEGERKGLKFISHIYPSGFEIEFYQDINFSNRNGGRYDFDKLERMPYLMRLYFSIVRKYILEMIEEQGFVNRADPEFNNAMDKVMYRIKNTGHYEDGIELPEYEFPSYNATDKNGKMLHNGDVKYYRDHKGRLMRGTIYHHLNNMWFIILNDKDWTVEASFRLFDLTTKEDYIRKIYSRDIPHRIRAKKLRKSFNEKFSYKVIKEFHIYKLRDLIEKKLTIHPDKEMQLRLKEPLKKELVVMKRTGLKSAEIKVNGSYFTGREAITFSQSGYIGFADWASGYNLKPFVDAFGEWLNWLEDELKEG